jgi:NAD(P)-dependent dehydrogenase (short-subunit alcohol dehydrogenase family)
MSNRTAIVTGAGSGVGRAVSLRLAAEGWDVALLGRRSQPLEETRNLAGKSSARLHIFECNVADPAAVERVFAQIMKQPGNVRALVNCAGTNIPRRSLEVLSVDDYRALIDANLNGTFYCVRAVLPAMRQQGEGTIVNIVSDAGLIANAKAGPAYVASKFGVAGLTQSINAEERERGIRATGIFPGDIDTPILDKRPAPPPADARKKMLQPDDVAACVMLAINLPPRAIVEQLLIRPR